MVRRFVLLVLALIMSGAPAALQMCGSHCVTPVSCHEAPAPDGQLAVKAGPQVCPHAGALGAVLGTKSMPPKQTTDAGAVIGVVNQLHAPFDVPIEARPIDRLVRLSPQSPHVQHLRI